MDLGILLKEETWNLKMSGVIIINTMRQEGQNLLSGNECI